MIRVRSVDAAAEWDEILMSQDGSAEDGPSSATDAMPGPHALQSWTWGELKARWGWHVQRLVVESAGQPVAAAQAMWRRVGRLPLRIGYVPKGPYVPGGSPAAWAVALEAIETWAKAERLAFVKIDADVPADERLVLDERRRRGWRPSAEQIQFRNTMRTDLRVGADALMAGMHPKTRYNIRLAQRRGVRVRAAGHSGIPAALELYRETAARQNFAIRAPAYYRDAWSAWLEAGMGEILLAELDGEPLAAAVPVRFGHTAWYLYGASSNARREAMAAYAVMWEALAWARTEGARTFDWWGGPDSLDTSDPLWGVYRFKLGFGARFDEQAGAWDFPSHPVLYRLYRAAAWARATARARLG